MQSYAKSNNLDAPCSVIISVIFVHKQVLESMEGIRVHEVMVYNAKRVDLYF
jgi:hypothetical protein